MNKLNENKAVRVACYVRVSSEEQAREGFSIPAQIEHLKRYIDGHDEMALVDFYVDEGISADKLKKRLAMQRLLRDVEAGKVDMIVFTKLDRWTRNIKKYYQVQEILEANNVVWEAILEDYSTKDANSRFKLNIMLSVAQQERERTSERIKDVFEYKVRNGEAIQGNASLPFGFELATTPEGKKIIAHKPEHEAIVKDLVREFYLRQSLNGIVTYAMQKYELNFTYENVRNMFTCSFMYGGYRDNPNYCEPYITKAEYDEIQFMIKRNIKEIGKGKVYLFSSMLPCPECGKNLIGNCATHTNKDGSVSKYLSYRCRNNLNKNTRTCSFSNHISQRTVQEQLLEQIKPMLEKRLLSIKDNEKKISKPKDTKKIQEEMDRLTNVFIKGRIKEVEYEKAFATLKSQLDESTTHSQINAKPKASELMDKDLAELLDSFNDVEKKIFYRSIIKEIHIGRDKVLTDIIFL